MLITRTTGSFAAEGLAQHEAGLRQRALGGVDEQQHAVDHDQAALDLAAEVGVAGGVDDVDLQITAVADRRVLGEDRDALLALEVHRVHDALVDVLVGAERPGLPEHGVDEGRLAVVDVRDDGDVAEVIARRHRGIVRAVGASTLVPGSDDRHTWCRMGAPATVIYDDTCGVCARLVTLVRRRRREDAIALVPRSSERGHALIGRHFATAPESIVLITAAGPATRSDAILGICARLGGGYRLAALARVVPTPLRDRAYAVFARNRHRLTRGAPPPDSCATPRTR